MSEIILSSISASDGSNTVEMFEYSQNQAVSSTIGGLLSSACFDGHIYFNDSSRGLWRYDPETDTAMKLIDSTIVGAPAPHTPGSVQEVYSVKSGWGMLFAVTDSDVLVSYDGLIFQSIDSSLNSFIPNSVGGKPKIIGTDEVGYYLVYNVSGGMVVIFKIVLDEGIPEISQTADYLGVGITMNEAIIVGNILYVATNSTTNNIYRFDLTQATLSPMASPTMFYLDGLGHGYRISSIRRIQDKLIISSRNMATTMCYLHRADLDLSNPVQIASELGSGSNLIRVAVA
jgi:hypothetical protein